MCQEARIRLIGIMTSDLGGALLLKILWKNRIIDKTELFCLDIANKTVLWLKIYKNLIKERRYKNRKKKMKARKSCKVIT